MVIIWENKAAFFHLWVNILVLTQNSPVQTKPLSDINEMRGCKKSSVKSTITQYRFRECAGGSLFTTKHVQTRVNHPSVKFNYKANLFMLLLLLVIEENGNSIRWKKHKLNTFPLVPATWIIFIWEIGSSKSSIYFSNPKYHKYTLPTSSKHLL